MANDDRLLHDLREALGTGAEPSDEQVAEFRRIAAERLKGADPVSTRTWTGGWWLSAAAVVVIAVGALVALPRQPGTVEYDGPMMGPGDVTAQVEVVALGIGREISLTTGELAILPTGEYYELWFVGPSDSPENPDRISAGTFHPDADGRSDIRFVAAVNPDLYPTMEITAEPGDGNPAPTGPVVLETQIP